MPESPPFNAGFGTPWAEQIEFLRQKLRLPTERWDDIQRAAHDRAFIVAGAAKADLLADLHQAVLEAAEQGKGQAAFLRDFKAVVAKHGWTGWTGEGSPEGEAWRARVIYQTNMASSYAAGRYRQFTDPDYLRLRPYWRYIHSAAVHHPRPQHLAWHGLTLRHDHPFWSSHFAPNGWGCRCRITPVSRKEGEASAKAGLGEPPAGWDSIDPKTGAPKGIDKGFDYAPGATWHPQLDKYPFGLAQQIVAANLQDGVLDRWLSHIGQQTSAAKESGMESSASASLAVRQKVASGERIAVAVLNDKGRTVLGVKTQTVWLSDDTVVKQTLHRAGQDIPVQGYVRVQDILSHAQWVIAEGSLKLIYYEDGADLAVAVIKATANLEELYLLSLRRANRKELATAIKSGKAVQWD